MDSNILFLMGRFLFGFFFIFSGITHFTKTKYLAQYAASKKILFPRLSVVVSGFFILFGGLSILLGIYVIYGIILLSVFLLVTSLFMHNFWAVSKEQKQIERINFMKNMALLGATIMLLKIPFPWVFSLG